MGERLPTQLRLVALHPSEEAARRPHWHKLGPRLTPERPGQARGQADGERHPDVVQRRWLGPGLRLLATAVMLAVLLPRLHSMGPLPGRHGRPLLLLALAVGASLVGIVLSALRWQRVLQVLGHRLRMRTLMGLCLAGQFVGNFLPSTVGGDVLRITRLARLTKEAAGSLASVVIERMTGWIVLPVVTLAAFIANPGLASLGSSSRLAMSVALVSLLLLIGLLVLVGHPRLGGRLAERKGFARFAGAIHLGVGRLRSRPLAAVQVLTVGFAYQVVMVLAVFLIAAALGLGVSLTAMLAFVPVVAILQALPLTLGGLGLREGAFVILLAPLGVSTSHAIALGLLVYGVNLLVSLLGAPSYAAGGVRLARAGA